MKILMVAGGQGTKVWPFSRKTQPKQFQKIVGEESLFTKNIQMLLTKYSPGDIFISTKKMYIDYVKEQASEIPQENYIIEPDLPQGRGPAEGLAFVYLALKHPEEPFTIIQSDCLYIPEENYLKTLDFMEDLVIRDKKFISGGLVPSYPVLGVDYLSLGEEVASENGAKVFAVKEFLGRKSDYAETSKMIDEENVVIHTNINTWYPEQMLAAYKEHRPDWHAALMQISEVLKKDGPEAEIEEIYSGMEAGSTEAVTQHVFEQGYIVIYPFKWVDIGTWDSVYEFLSQDNSMYTEGNVVSLSSSGTLVKSTNPKKLIAVLGLENMVVVDTDDILFIAPRDKLGDIKKVQEELRDQGLEDYL